MSLQSTEGFGAVTNVYEYQYEMYMYQYQCHLLYEMQFCQSHVRMSLQATGGFGFVTNVYQCKLY